ncbi:MAG: hypothetical protein L0Y54_02825 [Sporichthyaceae bacterium]|nr:hypothetical protein [Sporichthyaceae bacterium]
MRVYVPTTLTGLAAVAAAGGLGAQPFQAYAVTPALREWYVAGDLEELEYAAMAEAARASLRMLVGDPDVPRRRVVIALDVGDVAVTQLSSPLDGEDRGAVRVGSVATVADIAAIHVDGDDAIADVTAATEALAAADTGDDDAQFVVDGAEDHELLWYASQEIPDLLRLR